MCRRQYSRDFSASHPLQADPPPIRRSSAPRLRIGDAEREAAASELSEHYALGRLDQDEFNRRLDTVFAAHTGGELEPVFSDLPRGSRRRTPRPQRGAVRSRPAVPPIAALLTVAVVVATVAAIAGGFPPFFLFALLWVWRGHRHAWR